MRTLQTEISQKLGKPMPKKKIEDNFVRQEFVETVSSLNKIKLRVTPKLTIKPRKQRNGRVVTIMNRGIINFEGRTEIIRKILFLLSVAKGPKTVDDIETVVFNGNVITKQQQKLIQNLIQQLRRSDLIVSDGKKGWYLTEPTSRSLEDLVNTWKNKRYDNTQTKLKKKDMIPTGKSEEKIDTKSFSIPTASGPVEILITIKTDGEVVISVKKS